HSGWMDPPTCAVGEPRNSNRGALSFPLVQQNGPRYMLFLSLGGLALLWVDAWKAFWYIDPETGVQRLGIGVGTLVLLGNCLLLSSYLLGCHTLRHIAGGCVDQLSRAPLRGTAYSCVSCLNRRHMLWAWCSLVSVGFSDLYVRLCSMGVWSDVRIL
ncbi:MAG: succinate dehydrogenase, partial [Vicinamibacterales bacterium]